MARKAIKRKKSKSLRGETQANEQTRRATMGQIVTWTVSGAVLLGGGSVFAMDIRKKLIEQDLSGIGQGTPVIVQIHDPQCGLCIALQRQTRKALRAFSDEDVVYRVANIDTKDGAAHQQREGLPHVTLVLYDGRGQRVHVIQGVTPANELIKAFQKHLRLTPV